MICYLYYNCELMVGKKPWYSITPLYLFTNDVLDFARPESGKMPVARHPVDVIETARSAVDLLRRSDLRQTRIGRLDYLTPDQKELSKVF